MMTRAEHLAWCKQRALAYLDRAPADTLQAFTSMGSDLDKHPDTANHIGVKIGMQLLMIGDLTTEYEMRHFIEGFN